MKRRRRIVRGCFRRGVTRPRHASARRSPTFLITSDNQTRLRPSARVRAPKQVAYAGKALKASPVAPKAVARRGVVAMSAKTDEIIESMKTLTVSSLQLASRRKHRIPRRR